MANYEQYGFSASQYATASQVYTFFKNEGWTDNAIFGMLGNMTQESSMDPNEWQNNDVGDMGVGYGLVQWTPATKLINWCNSNGYNYTQTQSQCARILYELNNGLQYAEIHYNISFRQYTQLNESLSEMTKIFCSNYEQAGIAATENRITYANQWSSVLSDIVILPDWVKQVNTSTPPLLSDCTVTPYPYTSLDCKELPSNNSNRNGSFSSGAKVKIYAKCGEWFLVNNATRQWVSSEYITIPSMPVQHTAEVINSSGAICRENPCATDQNTGVVPYGRVLNVYEGYGHFYLVNISSNLQWVSLDDVQLLS